MGRKVLPELAGLATLCGLVWSLAHGSDLSRAELQGVQEGSEASPSPACPVTYGSHLWLN